MKWEWMSCPRCEMLTAFVSFSRFFSFFVSFFCHSDAELKEGIANFYDKSTNIWEDMWGEHMHHGYYVEGNKPRSMDDHR